MKLSSILIAGLVAASLSANAQQEKPKTNDPPPGKGAKAPVRCEKKKDTRPEDKRKAKRDSINNSKLTPEKWNCPPCGMG